MKIITEYEEKGRSMKTRATRLLLLLLVGLSIIACNSNKTNKTPKTPPVTPVKLTTPANLQITGTTLTWNQVTNASGYKVDIGGILKDTTSASYSLYDLPPGTYQIKVMAKGNGTAYTDSDWSAAREYKFEPIVLYELPETLEIDIGIYDETGRLGAITKDVLAYIDQVEVDDPQNAARHYVSYPLAEILAYMGITGDYTEAFGVASDNYNATGTIDDAYIAVVRRHANGNVESTNNFPRFLVPSGTASGNNLAVSNVTTITLEK